MSYQTVTDVLEVVVVFLALLSGSLIAYLFIAGVSLLTNPRAVHGFDSGSGVRQRHTAGEGPVLAHPVFDLEVRA